MTAVSDTIINGKAIDSSAARSWIREALDPYALDASVPARIHDIRENMPSLRDAFKDLVAQELTDSLDHDLCGGVVYTKESLESYAKAFNAILDDTDLVLRGPRSKSLRLEVDGLEDDDLQGFRIGLVDISTNRIAYRNPIDPDLFRNGSLRIIRNSRSASQGASR